MSAQLPGEPTLVARPLHRDHRGYFSRVYGPDLPQVWFPGGPLQVNLSHTAARGAVRGIHFQRAPEMESKIVSCLSGRILDIVVDIRPDSPGFLQSTRFELDEESGRSLVVPTGFAHGFQTLSEDVRILYFHERRYDPALAGRIHPLDPALALRWPLEISEMSQADADTPPLAEPYEAAFR